MLRKNKKRIEKILLLGFMLFVFLIFSESVSAQCVNLSDPLTFIPGVINGTPGNFTVNGSFTMCTDTYIFNDTGPAGVLQVINSNLTINCNGSIFIDNGSLGLGVDVFLHNNITIFNCTFVDYAGGASFVGIPFIKDINFSNNIINLTGGGPGSGIFGVNIINSTFDNNIIISNSPSNLLFFGVAFHISVSNSFFKQKTNQLFQPGIQIIQGTNITFLNNNLSGPLGPSSVYLSLVFLSKFTNNYIDSNKGGFGFSLNFSKNNQFFNNTIDGNGGGLNLFGSSNSNAFYNTSISDTSTNFNSLQLSDSINNTFNITLINNSGDKGVYFFNSSENIFNQLILRHSDSYDFNFSFNSINNTFNDSIIGPLIHVDITSNFTGNNFTIIDDSSLASINYIQLNVTNIDTNNNLNLSFNLVDLNSSALQPLNRSANITFFGLPNAFTPLILRDGLPCPPAICTPINYNPITGDFLFEVLQFTSYSTGLNANLTIFDENDPEGGSLNKKVNEQIKFFANYTNISSGLPINASFGNCTIEFNTTPNGPFNMTFNSTLNLWEFNRTFNASGTYTWNVTCNGTFFELLFAQDNITVGLRNASLNLFDENDQLGGNKNITKNQQIKFFANYTDNLTKAPINVTGNCTINFNVTPTGPFNMVYNSTNFMWEYNRTFLAVGQYDWNVTCNSTIHQTLTASTNVTIVDIFPPYLINIFPPDGSVNRPINTNINFTIIDNDTAINLSSLIVLVQGVDVTGLSVLTVHDPKNVTVFYNPGANFPYSTDILVEVNISDNASNLLATNFTFRTKAKDVIINKGGGNKANPVKTAPAPAPPPAPPSPNPSILVIEIKQDGELTYAYEDNRLVKYKDILLKDETASILEFTIRNSGNSQLNVVTVDLGLPDNVEIIEKPEPLPWLTPDGNQVIKVKVKGSNLQYAFDMYVFAKSSQVSLRERLPVLVAPREEFPFQIGNLEFPSISILIYLLIGTALLFLMQWFGAQRVQDILQRFIGFVFRVYAIDENMLRQLIVRNKVHDYKKLYVTRSVYLRYHNLYKNLKEVKLKQKELFEVTDIQRRYKLKLEYAILSVFLNRVRSFDLIIGILLLNPPQTSARVILTTKEMPIEMEKKYSGINFVDPFHRKKTRIIPKFDYTLYDKNIISYIKKALSTGADSNEIKKRLLKSGWRKKKVDRHVKVVQEDFTNVFNYIRISIEDNIEVDKIKKNLSEYPSNLIDIYVNLAEQVFYKLENSLLKMLIKRLNHDEIIKKLTVKGWKEKEAEKDLAIAKKSLANLNEYIQKTKATGFDIMQIRKMLIDYGWNQEIVDLYLRKQQYL